MVAVAEEATALLSLAAEDTDSSRISRQLLVPALGIVGEHAGLLPKSFAVLVWAGSRKTNLAGVIIYLSIKEFRHLICKVREANGGRLCNIDSFQGDNKCRGSGKDRMRDRPTRDREMRHETIKWQCGGNQGLPANPRSFLKLNQHQLLR